MRTRHTRAGHYEIRVQGRLEPRWATWFDGFTVRQEHDGSTVIAGTVVDQAALHGVLQSLRDLGLPLVSVTQQEDVLAVVPRPGRDAAPAVPTLTDRPATSTTTPTTTAPTPTSSRGGSSTASPVASATPAHDDPSV